MKQNAPVLAKLPKIGAKSKIIFLQFCMTKVKTDIARSKLKVLKQ